MKIIEKNCIKCGNSKKEIRYLKTKCLHHGRHMFVGNIPDDFNGDIIL